MATLLLIHHRGTLWEVVDVKVAKAHRRQGVATALYDAAETFNGSPIYSPSGWLTEDALAFWSKRRPGIEKGFIQYPGSDGLFVSAKQLVMLEKAASWRMAKLAAIEAVERALEWTTLPTSIIARS